MNEITPKVSVLMSVYNGSSYLIESIESILNQTFSDFEFIIINDCSTDSTWDILTAYAQKDNRIKLFNNEENIGLTKSLNKGLKLARGEYIARQDADDISLPKRLEKQVILLDKDPEIGLVSCDIEIIDAKGHKLGTHQRACATELVAWYLIFHNHLGGHSQVIFRRELVRGLEGYDESRRYSQDYELWSRIIRVSKIAILPEFLLQQRRHDRSISVAKGSEQKNYSLSQSKQNIEQLIGKEISLEEVEYLRSFWLGSWWPECFPNPEIVRNLNLILTDIYQAFVNKFERQDNFERDLSQKLRILIGKQFLYWIEAPWTKQQGLISKVKISYYAFAWRPSGILSSWLKLFWKTLIRLVKMPVRQIHYRKVFRTN